MPEISRFFGLIITMYYNDHPPPHFHVRYGEQRAVVEISSLSILAGGLSPRAYGLVIEWAAKHQKSLLKNWEHAEQAEPLQKIPPLE